MSLTIRSKKTRELEGKPIRKTATATASAHGGRIRQSLLSGLKLTSFGSKQKRIIQSPSTESESGLQKSPIEQLAPELLFLIFSHLRISEFFPLRLAGSRYLLSAIRNFQAPLPSLREYLSDFRQISSSQKISEVKGGLPRRMVQKGMSSVDLMILDDKRICLTLAACRGQDSLIIAIMEDYRTADFQLRDNLVHHRSALSFGAEYGYIHTAELLLKFKERKVWYRDKHGHSALDYAARNGQIEMVKFLIGKGCKIDPGIQQRERELRKSRGLGGGWGPLSSATPLVWAVRGEQTAMVKFLLESGAKKHLERDIYNGYKSETPLEAALCCGNMEIVKILVDAGAPMDSTTLVAGLHASIAMQRAEMVRFICQNGCSVRGNEQSQEPPLIQACRHGNVEIIRLLLEHGASIDRLSSHLSGISALYQAVMAGHFEAVVFLINQEVDPAKDRSSRRSLLYEAASRDFYAIMEVLLASGIKVETTDVMGTTPFHAAIERPSIRALQMLLEAGASRLDNSDSPTTGEFNDTLGKALLYASLQAKQTAVEEIMKYGPPLDYQDKQGCTALHYAAFNGDLKILNLLLINGASLEVRDEIGQTPMLAASYVRKSEAVAMLISAGADETARDSLGKSRMDMEMGMIWRERRWQDKLLPAPNPVDYSITTRRGWG